MNAVVLVKEDVVVRLNGVLGEAVAVNVRFVGVIVWESVLDVPFTGRTVDRLLCGTDVIVLRVVTLRGVVVVVVPLTLLAKDVVMVVRFC